VTPDAIKLHRIGCGWYQYYPNGAGLGRRPTFVIRRIGNFSRGMNWRVIDKRIRFDRGHDVYDLTEARKWIAEQSK
jgi:hypothetical protein